MKRLLIIIIKAYQKTLSPDHGLFSFFYPNGYCRFYPSCSDYAIKAIEKRGVFKGVGLGAWRVLRCNPWNKGGIDVVK